MTGEDRELENLRNGLTDLMLEMELRHSRDSEEEFQRWWQEEGNERRYFQMKRDLEIREETIRKMEMLENLELSWFTKE